MIVLDTHIWIWWLSDPGKLSQRAGEAVRNADMLGVPSICCWEIATQALRGKLRLDREITTWVRQALSEDRITALDLTTRIALDAALLADSGLHGDPADRIIAATALVHDCPLVTKDRALRNLNPLHTIW